MCTWRRASLTLALVLLVVLAPRSQSGGAEPEIEFQLPMRGNVSVLGYLPGKGDHYNTDLYAVDFTSDNPAVYPTAPGTVVYAAFDCSLATVPGPTPVRNIQAPGGGPDCKLPEHKSVYGNTVVVAHADGFYSIYTHLASADPGRAKLSQPVRTTDQIGVMSTSGCPPEVCGKDPHLHFAIHRDRQFATRAGTPGLQGRAALWNIDFEAVNAWERISGLPDPSKLKSPVYPPVKVSSVPAPPAPLQPGTPPPARPQQLKFTAPSLIGWWLTVYACGNGSAPVRLDGKTIFDKEPNQASFHVGGGDHVLEWSDTAVSVNFVWWPLSPPACPPVLPKAAALLEDSIVAMRGLAKIEAQAEGGALLLSGSGQIKLTLPDAMEGQWEGFGHSVRLSPAPGGTAVLVDGQQQGLLAGKGAATAVRDALLSLPNQASDWQVRMDGGAYQLEGALSAEAVNAIAKMVAFGLPGSPSGRLVLVVDPSSKLWHKLELKLIWAAARFEVFGREFELGTTASTALTFAGGAK